MLAVRPIDPVAIEKQLQSAASPDAPSNRWDVPVRSFVLAFVGLLCATVIGFVSEVRPLNPDSPDYGYDEALGTESSSPSSATLESICSCDSAASAGASKDALDGLAVTAIAAHAAESPTANFTSRE